MSMPLGRMVFVGFIWVYALIYYLEVMELDDSSEWMTVAAVFWLFTLFVGLELRSLLRALRSEKGPGNPFNRQALIRIAKDGRTQLIILMAIYLFFIPLIGFHSSSFLAFCAFSLALGARGLMWVLLGGVLVPLIIYIIFTFFLKLTLPSGILF